MTPVPGTDLAETLAEAFEEFEAIRRLARQCEDQAPDLFAAFMSTAAAAADGRDALLAAATVPALAPTRSAHPERGADPQAGCDAIAATAAALAARLDRAAAQATAAEDHRACHQAAAMARQIYQFMAPG